MYHRPSESQLVRIIEFVSGAGKNWNHKILFVIRTCGEVINLSSHEGWGTPSTLSSLYLLKQSESFRSINKFEYRQALKFFSHLDTWPPVHKLWLVVLCRLYINDFLH